MKPKRNFAWSWRTDCKGNCVDLGLRFRVALVYQVDSGRKKEEGGGERMKTSGAEEKVS